MTKIIKIDCDKWSTIIGISLWIGFTIGLGYLSYYSYDSFVKFTPKDCTQADPFSKDYYCTTKGYDGAIGSLGAIYEVQVLELLICIVPTLVNTCFIWREINFKLDLIKIQCNKKEVKYKLNDKYKLNRTYPKEFDRSD